MEDVIIAKATDVRFINLLTNVVYHCSESGVARSNDFSRFVSSTVYHTIAASRKYSAICCLIVASPLL